MRKTILLAAAAASHLLATLATAAVTVSTLDPANYVENHADLFDVAQGATITGASGGYPTFAEVDAIGAVSASSIEPGQFIFNDFYNSTQTQTFTFQTVEPVAISGFNLYLGADANGAREFDFVQLLGSLDNVTFTNLGEVTLAGPTYEATYGSDAILVQSTFAAASYMFFRLNAHDRVGFQGGRILELDAIAATAAVPEPGSAALLLVGLVGIAGLVRRRLR